MTLEFYEKSRRHIIGKFRRLFLEDETMDKFEIVYSINGIPLESLGLTKKDKNSSDKEKLILFLHRVYKENKI